MVYEEKTLRLCHELAPQAKDLWQDFLEKAADEILFKAQHPFKYFLRKLLDTFKNLKD